MFLLFSFVWLVVLRGLFGFVFGIGGGDFDCFNVDDGGIIKFFLLFNFRDLEEI